MADFLYSHSRTLYYNMELRQLKYFVKSAEYLNFSEAAKHLYITQSTLSQQIKQLEFELGFSLFYRNSRCIELTEAGEEFLPFAKRTIQDAEDGVQRLFDLQNVCGYLVANRRCGNENCHAVMSADTAAV